MSRNYKISPSAGQAAKSPRAECVETARRSYRPARASDSIHARAYCIPSWLDSAGVAKKRKLIEAKGLPNFQNWRFITLTCKRNLDPNRNLEDAETPDFTDALEAYQKGSDRMRRFLLLCREAGLWNDETPWCWKFEFQSDGFPHWHLLVGQKKMFTYAQMRLIHKFWGLGRTNVKRVNARKFRYDFKYAFKSVRQDNAEGGELESLAPAWFLDYYGSKIVTVKWTDADGVEHSERTEKPATFSRVRFWQTSRGFYTGKAPEVPPAKKPVAGRAVRTVRQILHAQFRTLQIVARRSDGSYVSSMAVPLECTLKEFWNLIGYDGEFGAVVGLGFYSAIVSPHRIKTNDTSKWNLNKHLTANSLTMNRARYLRSRGKRLQRC